MRFTLILPLVCATLAATAAPARAQDTLTDVPVKFVGMRQGMVFGRPCYFATVTALAGDKKYEIVVPNNDATIAKLDPVEGIYGPLKDAKPGDLFVVTTKLLSSNQMFDGCMAFKPKTGEDEPGCYVLSSKAEQGSGVAVVLSKMLVEMTVPIAMAKNEAGKMAPNEAVLKAIEGAGMGAVVIVTIEKGAIKSLKPYEAPQDGELAKHTTAKVDDKSVPAVEMTVSGGGIVMLLLPKGNAAVATKAKSIKPGTKVHYRSDAEGDWTTLTEIWAASK